MIEDYTSPNQSPRSAYGWNGNPDGITWHWWNTPAQAGTFESTINFFCTSAAQTSAHFIVSDKRVACIVSPSEAAWHAGSTEGNGRTIGVEIDPRLPGDTLETCAELAADLERQFGSLNHYGHKDWTQTECPGIVYDKIPWLIDRTNEILGNGGSSGSTSSGSGNMEAAIAWFQNRAGAVTYSMDYRNGPGSYDCSSSVYYALMDAGINTVGKVGNTETMFSDLPSWGFREVQATVAGIPAQRGDIFIWGDPGSSAGAAGHTGIFVDSDNILHCNFGYNGITLNNHDYIWSANGSPSCHIFRYVGGGSSSTHTQTVTKDWFDMASRQDLAEVVNDVLHQNDGFFRQKVHQVLHEERFNREGTINGKPVGGSTTIAMEAAWAAANAGGVKADVVRVQGQVEQLVAEVQALKEGK
ncbi:peptidoglycan amidohydrolase family protein [Rothia koreensis]|uniref:peptidoglycan amidohydrolase family protein n=1 Tax=Rothia koreensis TaxID=592378 RepID=UPI003FCEBB51